MQGTFLANAKGFGFVAAEDLEKDLFVPEGMTGTALDGDLVEVRLLPTFDGNCIPEGKDGRRQEAEVTRIVTRNTTSLVGTFYGKNGSGSVIPDNRKIPADVRIPGGCTMGAVNGHKVVVHITDYGEGKTAARRSSSAHLHGHGQSTVLLTGEITEILGHMDDPGVDILSIIRAYNLPQEFPDEVMRQVRRIPQELVLTDEVRNFREDWRDVLTVTIDGPDTKDIDDAISVRRLKGTDGDSSDRASGEDTEKDANVRQKAALQNAGQNGKEHAKGGPAVWELGVHIADVAQYVFEDTALDKEARKRATSNYLVDRVIPMLPHELSNGIFSLNPGEDRFALSCIMQMDKAGNVVDARIAETIIRSDAKLSYPGVMQLFEEKDEAEILHPLELQGIRRGAKTRSHAIAAMLRRGLRLSGILSKKRSADGAIDFEFPECKILLDEQGQVKAIEPYERNAATKMIENFMVAANETVAEHFYWLGIPFVYRTHGVPTEEKMEQLREFVRCYGYRLRWDHGDVHPKELQALLSELKGKPEEATISVMTLRSMQRAMYTTTCGGHFGLALRYYCHFTSPIRRYPDLQIHRIIKEYLHGKLDEKRRAHYDSILPEVCRQSSDMERRADEAERETGKQKMCEYMKGHLGEDFEGTVSGVTGWGIYVQLPNTIEGLVPVRSLRDDYYEYDEKTARLVGERSGRAYRLGQPVRVNVASVDTTARTIDFELYQEGGAQKEQKDSGKSAGERKPSGPKRLTTKGEIPMPKKSGRRRHHGSGHGKKRRAKDGNHAGKYQADRE